MGTKGIPNGSHNIGNDGYPVRVSLYDEPEEVIETRGHRIDCTPVDDYMEMHGRNSEGYKDPTYIQAMRNLDGNGHHKSRRYKLMGVIFKACALADFELVGRITLRDKKTGEILR